MFLILPLIVLITLSPITFGDRTIRVKNHCSHELWISPLTSSNGPPLSDGFPYLAPNEHHVFRIPDSGWEGRIWPKTGCNEDGQACAVGQSIAPCDPSGCPPPAETKIEFFFPPVDEDHSVWYDISLVDGYTLPVEIIPSRKVCFELFKLIQIQSIPSLEQTGSCVRTDCRISLEKCPTDEDDVGDLRIRNENGETVACLAPCKRWNYPAPFGLGRDEQEEAGLQLCCPTPPVSTEVMLSSIISSIL